MWQKIEQAIVGSNSSWFWTMIQAVGVVVSLWVICRQLRIQNFANMLSAFAGFEQRWANSRMRSARQAICEDCIVQGNAPVGGLTAVEDDVLTFFEDLGLLVKRRVLSKTVAWERCSYIIEQYWNILKVKVEDVQTTKNDPTFYENFKWLARAMAAISRKRGVSPPEWTLSQIVDFARWELEKLARHDDAPQQAGALQDCGCQHARVICGRAVPVAQAN